MGGKISIGRKFWLELDGRPLIGRGRYELLRSIDRLGSLKQSAEMLGVSYRTAQNYIRKIEERLGNPVVKTRRGGDGAGGLTQLNETGRMLVLKFEEAASRGDAM